MSLKASMDRTRTNTIDRENVIFFLTYYLGWE